MTPPNPLKSKAIRDAAIAEIGSTIFTLIAERRQLQLFQAEILTGGWPEEVKDEFLIKATECHHVIEDILMEFNIRISPAYTYTQERNQGVN